MKMQIQYSPSELRTFTKKSFFSLLKGITRIGWAIILLLINSFLWCVKSVKKAIYKAPCLACGIIALFMLLLSSVSHMNMKVKLTTAEWQRDSLESKLDSIKNLYGNKVSYFKYQKYTEE